MSTGPKQDVFAEFAAVARALGHPARLELLELLGQREQSVEILASRSGLSLANASQHLQKLQRAGLVAARREGRFTRYRLADDKVLGLLTALRQVAERRVANVDRIVRDYFSHRDALEPVSRDDLLERLRTGTVTVLDVRPPDEYAAGHVPGALNVSIAELNSRLLQLDPQVEVVAYCRGAYCVLSFEAVALMRDRGFTVRRLEEGFPEWKAAGLPVASCASVAR